MAKLETLVIDLQLQTASLKKSVDEATAKMDSFGKKATSALSGINFSTMAAGLKRITTALFRFVADGAKAADQTTVLGKRAGEFTENSKRLGDALHSVGARVAIDVGPAFTRLTNFFFESKTGAQVLNTAVLALSYALRTIATIAIGVGAAFSVIGTALAGLAAAFAEAVTGNFEGAVEIIADMRKMLGEEIGTAGELIKDVWSDAGDSVGESADVIIKEADKVAERMAELRKQADFELELKLRVIDRGLLKKQEDFGNIGKTQREVLGSKTTGFDDFNAAATKAADAMTVREKLLSQAAVHRGAKEFELARRAEEAAEAQGLLAESAEEATDAFAKVKELDLSEAQKELEHFVSGIAAVGTQFTSKLGELGSVINAGIQGAQSGGVWGAIIAVIIELLSKFERFSEILDIGSGALQTALTDMAGGFNGLIDGLRPLFGALEGIMKGIHAVIGPIIGIVGKLFGQLAATLGPVGYLLSMIGSTLSPVFTIISAVVDVLKIFQPILSLVSIALLGLKLSMDYVTLGFNLFLDWVLEQFGQNNNSGVDAAEATVANDLKDIEKIWKQLEKDPLNSMTNAANETADELEILGQGISETEFPPKPVIDGIDGLGSSAKMASTELNRLTASFTNVPQGFRYNWRAFGAQDAQTIGQVGSIAGQGHTSIYVAGSLVHQEQLQAIVKQHQDRAAFQSTGKWG